MSTPGRVATPEKEGRRKRRIGVISLGCAKNLVDSEVLLGSAAGNGFEITADPSEADVVVVNTCGFIDAAKQESIDAILEAHERRLADGRPDRKLVVGGCLSQRYHADLARELPEVDAFIGLDQVAEAGRIIERLFEQSTNGREARPPLDIVPRRSRYIPDYDTPRFRLTPAHSTYVKIAEGCNHPCTFCVIPRMRGRHRSRSIDSIVHEIRRLVAEGVREFNLISQDTTYFGMDQWESKAGPRQPVDSTLGPTLVRLLDAIGEIEGDFWVRLLYTHPAHWSDELISAIAAHPKVVKYVDMPLQHIHGEMLASMRRETSREHIEDLIDRMRAGIPGLAIRTTFITGFPGETDEHFDSLLEFIMRRRFERLGVFAYSREEGSRAAAMADQVPAKVAARRLREAMGLQQRIAAELAASRVGERLRVLADQPLVARSEHDAPDVDCRVLLDQPAAVGEFLDVKITGSQVYDLVAERA